MLTPDPTLDYRLIIPSRKRSENVPSVRELLPTATWYVDERERDDYASAVPDDLLATHVPVHGYAGVMNKMKEDFSEDALAFVDDDLQGVEIMADGNNCLSASPTETLNYIENMVRVLQDLDLTWGGCGDMPTAWIFGSTDNIVKPFKAVGTMGGGLRIIRGNAKVLQHYPDGGREDVDHFLEILREDRAMLYDQRVLFTCALDSGNKGGNTGLVSGDEYHQGEERLKVKWGRAVSFKRSAAAHAIGLTGRSCNIAVNRINPRLQ